MSKAVYKSAKSEKIILDLYDKQVLELNIEFEDVYVDTRFGKTHLFKIGNPNGKSIILFKRFSLLYRKIFDICTGYKGSSVKCAKTVLSSKNLD